MSGHRFQPRRLRIAVLSSLYPNSRQPRHGIFVEERLRALLESGLVEARVIAPVPWFFSTNPRFGHYARLAGVPAQETRHGIQIAHPRYVVLPRVGMRWAPASMARAATPALEALRAGGFDFDLIDAHYLYPDAVAAARLARRFRRPLVITARGSDVNVIAEMADPRRRILEAADTAGAVITVSEALRARLQQLGVAPAKLVTLRNGVDLGRFSPTDRDIARTRLSLSGPVWLFVGHLVSRKGPDIAVKAAARVPDVTLVLAGEGPEAAALRAQAARLGIAERVRFAGHVDHDALAGYYAAADALVLPTVAEGMPNVVLEAMACGTAIIATAVGGIPEIVPGLPAGSLLAERSADAVVSAWRAVRAAGIDQRARARRRAHATSFDWQATTAGQLQVFARLAPGILPAHTAPASDTIASADALSE